MVEKESQLGNDPRDFKPKRFVDSFGMEAEGPKRAVEGIGLEQGQKSGEGNSKH